MLLEVSKILSLAACVLNKFGLLLLPVPASGILSPSFLPPRPVPPLLSPGLNFPRATATRRQQSGHKMAKYTPFRPQIDLRDRARLCLAYYPPKSDWQGGARLVRAGQDPVGIHVPRINRTNATLLRAEFLPFLWSRSCSPDKAVSPRALTSKAHNCGSHQYWEWMQQSG